MANLWNENARIGEYPRGNFVPSSVVLDCASRQRTDPWNQSWVHFDINQHAEIHQQLCCGPFCLSMFVTMQLPCNPNAFYCWIFQVCFPAVSICCWGPTVHFVQHHVKRTPPPLVQARASFLEFFGIFWDEL